MRSARTSTSVTRPRSGTAHGPDLQGLRCASCRRRSARRGVGQMDGQRLEVRPEVPRVVLADDAGAVPVLEVPVVELRQEWCRCGRTGDRPQRVGQVEQFGSGTRRGRLPVRHDVVSRPRGGASSQCPAARTASTAVRRGSSCRSGVGGLRARVASDVVRVTSSLLGRTRCRCTAGETGR